MYKRANTVYPILQHFFQKAYPVINQILGKKIPWTIPNIPEKKPSWAAPTQYNIYCVGAIFLLYSFFYSRKKTQLGGTYTYSKSIEEAAPRQQH